MSLDRLKEKVLKYDISGYSYHHRPQYGRILKEIVRKDGGVLVGGLVEGTSSTLKVPDHDIATQWVLEETLTEKLNVAPIDDGACGLYHLKIKIGEEEQFKHWFIDVVKDIHGFFPHEERIAEYQHHVEAAYLEVGGNTFINADLLRKQTRFNRNYFGGKFYWYYKFLSSSFTLMGEGKGGPGDLLKTMMQNYTGMTSSDTFSDTGSAMTFNMDFKQPGEGGPNTSTDPLTKFEFDLVNMFVIPYNSLPADLKIWDQRPSPLLTENTKRVKNPLTTFKYIC